MTRCLRVAPRYPPRQSTRKTGTSFASLDGNDRISHMKTQGGIRFGSQMSDVGGRTLFAEVMQNDVAGFGDGCLLG